MAEKQVREVFAELTRTVEVRGPKARYELTRPPAGPPLIGISLSHELYGIETHYWGNRTVPHNKPKCSACEAKIGLAWHNYFFLFSPYSGKILLIEITDGPVCEFDAWFKKFGTLRGAQVKLFRRGKRKNSPQGAELSSSNLQTIVLPAAPPLKDQLDRIWRGNIRQKNADGHVALGDEYQVTFLQEPSSSVVGNGDLIDNLLSSLEPKEVPEEKKQDCSSNLGDQIAAERLKSKSKEGSNGHVKPVLPG